MVNNTNFDILINALVGSAGFKPTADAIRKEKIIALYGEEIVNMAIDKIEEITKEKKDSFNFVWIPAIEEHEQTGFPERYEYQLVRLLRDSFKNLKIDKSKEIVEQLIIKNH